MKGRFVFRTAPWVLLFGALASTIAGCYTMSRVPARYISTERPPEIFVRDAEGAVFALSNPSIVEDSLIGTDGVDAVSLNLREVEAMAIRTISKPKTYGAVAAGVGVLGMITFGALKATVLKDCPRIPNRNNQCLNAVQDCKYGACDDDNGVN
jgi:hypothetical protein